MKNKLSKFISGLAVIALLASPIISFAQATVALPPQPGNAGKYLRTDGLNLSWAAGGGGGGGIVEGDIVTGCGAGEVIYDDQAGTVGCDPLFIRNNLTDEFTVAGSLGADPFAISTLALGSFLGGGVTGAGVTYDDATAGEYATLVTGDATVAIGSSVAGALTASDGTLVTTFLVVPSSITMSYEDTGTGFSGSFSADGNGINVEEYSLFSTASHDLLEFHSTVSGENFFVGTNVPTAITTGVFNFMGGGTAAPLTSGNLNSAWGYGAGNSISTGSSNTLIGGGAGNLLAGGSQNVFLGNNAGLISTTATQNVLIGFNAGSAAGNAIDNVVAIGYLSGQNITDAGVYNTFVGSETGKLVTSGEGNVLMGGQTGNSLTTGSQNTIIGNQAGQAITTHSDNTIIGSGAGRDGTSSFTRAVFVGRSAGEDNEANDNTFIGYFAGRLVTTGTRNVIMGANGGQNLSTGSSNVFVGQQAGNAITTTSDNVSIGDASLRDGATSSTRGVFIGRSAGEDNEADDNTFIGYWAGKNVTSGDHNVIVGSNTGTDLATGMDNVIIGATAAESLANENSNVIIGNDALQVSTTGASNVFIGDDVATGTTTAGDLNVIIGRNATLTNSVNSSIGIGGDVAVTASNQFVTGSVTSPYYDMYVGGGIADDTAQGITIRSSDAATNGNQGWFMELKGGDAKGTDQVSGGYINIIGGAGTGTGNGGLIALINSAPGTTGSALNGGSYTMIFTGEEIQFQNRGIVYNRAPHGNTDYTILTTDYIVVGTGFTADRTFTLPDASDEGNGKTFIVKNSADQTFNLILEQTGADTIDSSSAAITLLPAEAITVISDGVTNWDILSQI